jgi:hypothetical protein
MIGLFIFAVIRIWPPSSTKQALAIGPIWLLLTVIFEFTFGRLVMHRPWALLFHDYDLVEGRVWALFLVWLALAPYVFFRLRKAALPPFLQQSFPGDVLFVQFIGNATISTCYNKIIMVASSSMIAIWPKLIPVGEPAWK